MTREANYCAGGVKPDPPEAQLFKAYARSRSVRLRNEIVEKYMYIPSIVAGRFSGRGAESDDLLQVASLALIKAVERYDPDKGVKFASFATPTVVGEVKNYFRDRMRVIRLPRRGAETARQMALARQALEQRLFRAPTPDELAEYMNLTVEEVLEAHEIASSMNPVSIDAAMGDTDFSLEKVLGINEEGFEFFENRRTVEALLTGLTDEERYVVTGRYFENLSQRDLAKRMNVSQMTVSRTERRAMEKMKSAMREG